MKPTLSQLLLTLLAGTSLVGCMKVVSHEDVTSSKQIRSDQIIVVGKIELVPPLREKEQLLSSQDMVDGFKDKALILIDNEKYDISDLPSRSSRAASSVKLGETFFIPVDRDKDGNAYYSGGIIVVNDYPLTGTRFFGVFGMASAMRADHFDLAGKVKFGSRQSDRAIYIGTIRYHRDEFNAITRVEVLDQYNQARTHMAKTLKEELPLVKANLVKW